MGAPTGGELGTLSAILAGAFATGMTIAGRLLVAMLPYVKNVLASFVAREELARQTLETMRELVCEQREIRALLGRTQPRGTRRPLPRPATPHGE